MMTTRDVTFVGKTVVVDTTWPPATVVAALQDLSDDIDVDYSAYSGLRVICRSDATIAEAAPLKRQLRALKLVDAGRNGREVDVDVWAAPHFKCPACGWSVTREALEHHMDSPECKTAQNITALHDEGYVQVPGPATKAMERARIEQRWLLAAMSMGVASDGQPPERGGVDYIRLVPSWAVQLAECTIVPIDLRVAVIEHCDEHKTARAALFSALRLGPGRTRARAPQADDEKTEDQKKLHREEKERMVGLFKQALVTTG